MVIIYYIVMSPYIYIYISPYMVGESALHIRRIGGGGQRHAAQSSSGHGTGFAPWTVTRCRAVLVLASP